MDKDELKRLEKLDIIEKVDGPTPWVSPIVVAPKPKNPAEIRICVDMHLPKRERHNCLLYHLLQSCELLGLLE
jgi:hypothetical protein